MEKGSVGHVVVAVLAIAAGAGAVVAYLEMTAIREDLKALSGRVAQIERRGSEPTASTPTAATPVVLPSALPAASEEREIAAVCERIAALEESLAGGSSNGGATSSTGPAVTPEGAEEAAKIALSMSDEAKKAIAAVVKETIEQRDRERTVTWTTHGVERMLHRLTQELALSEPQKALIKPVLEERAKKMVEMFTSGNFDRESMRAQIDDLRKETDEAIKRYLTSEQAQKYDEVAAQNGGMGWYGGGRAGPGGSRGGGAQGGAR